MAVPLFLTELLSYTPFTGRLKPEEAACIYIRQELTSLTCSEKLKGIWFHIGNEGKRSRIVGWLLKAMGMIPGVHDYLHNYHGNTLFVEVKIGKNLLTKQQINFRMWCEMWGIPCVTVTASDPFTGWALYKAALGEHGFLVG